VAGEPVQEHQLVPGDVISAGQVVLAFEVGSDPGTSGVVLREVERDESTSVSGHTAEEELPLDPQDSRMLSLLGQLADTLLHIDEPRTLRRKLVTIVRQHLPVTRVMLALIPEDTTRLQPECWDFDPADPSGEKFELSAGLLRRILDQQTVVAFEEALGAAPGASVEAASIRSAMGAALREGGQVRGVMYADNRVDGVYFTSADRAFFGVIAGFAAATLSASRKVAALASSAGLEEVSANEERLVGQAPVMLALAERARRFARLRASILLLGERGTGKGVTARFVHDHSPRRAGPFIHVNCASIPETLAEAEFFGIAPGSGVSGAPLQGRPGYFQAAHEGTLFLDEVGDLPAPIQPKLLVVLREGQVTAVGASQSVPVDVRIIAATNRDLDAMSRENQFRNDLIDRLAAFTLRCPPLRERPEDLPGLAQYLLARVLAQEGIEREMVLSQEAIDHLARRRWEGNVAELENVLREAAALSDRRVIGVEDLPGFEREGPGLDLVELSTLAQVEAEHIEGVLRRLHWHKARAAEVLGVSRGTLDEKIRKHRLTPPPGMEVKPGRKPGKKPGRKPSRNS